MALLLAAAIVHHRRKEKKAREQREADELRRAEASLYHPPGAPQLPTAPTYSVVSPPPSSAVATTGAGAAEEPWPYWMPRPGHSEWDFAPKQAKRGLEHDPPAGRPHSVRSLPYDRPQASLLPPPARPPPTPTQASSKGKGMRSVRNFLSSSSSSTSSSSSRSTSAPKPTDTTVPSPVRDQSDPRLALRSRDEQESRIREIGDDDEDVAMDVEESDGSEQGLTSPGAMSP